MSRRIVAAGLEYRHVNMAIDDHCYPVMRALALADKLKSGDFASTDSFLRSLNKCEQEVRLWTDAEVAEFARRAGNRLARYQKLVWTYSSDAQFLRYDVWSKMGERHWAKGSVNDVAKLFRGNEPTESRIWKMKDFANEFATKLPIIVTELGSGMRIDDGCHRAVAMALAGHERCAASIGKLGEK